MAYSALSDEQLLKELEREQQLLTVLYGDLEEAETRLKQTLDSLNRVRQRRPLAEVQQYIASLQKRIADREAKIRSTEERVKTLEAGLPRQTSFNRYITRQVIADLRRSLSAYRGWQSRDRRTVAALESEQWIIRYYRLLEDAGQWERTVIALRSQIRTEEANIAAKKEELAKRRRLYRIKIRLYNTIGTKVSPVGMFQGWYTIDAILKMRTEEVDWNWWLTQREVTTAKYDFIAYFKGMGKWIYPEQLGLAEFIDRDGIPQGTKPITYLRTKMAGEAYARGVSPDLIRRAERLTVQDIIIGESTVRPEQNPNPSTENMGILRQRMLIVVNDNIKWDDRTEKWVWKPSQEQVEAVRSELGGS